MVKSISSHNIKMLAPMALAMTLFFFLAGCLQPEDKEILVEDTLSHVGCTDSFRKSLFDHIFGNLSQGKSLPSAEDLEPYVESQLQNNPKLSANDKNQHREEIKRAYLEVFETITRYQYQDLGLPGDYGAWLADLETGISQNEAQEQWAADLQRKLEALNLASSILDPNCSTPTTPTQVTSTPVSNEAFYLSRESIQARGQEAKELLEEREKHPYLQRGYLAAPTRIRTETEELAEEIPEEVSEPAVEQGLEDIAYGDLELDLAPAPSNWSPLHANASDVIFRPPTSMEPEEQYSTPATPASPQSPQGESPLVEHLFRSYHPVFAGALKTMAVLYQSCNVLDLDLVDSTNSQPLSGLKRIRTVSGFGRYINLYQILDRNQFSQRHFYLSQVDQSHDSEVRQCRNTPADFPSMYVYSGHAGVTNVTRDNQNIPAINLFQQSSHAAIEVGMDCSSFVGIAFQAAGLKLSTNSQCRAYDRVGSTNSFVRNAGGAWNCLFEPQKDSQNNNSSVGPVDLDTGDVFTIGGYHTVIIGQVAYHGDLPDPFQLRRITDPSQCRIENFPYSVFDFDIIHSSATRAQPGTTDTGLGVVRHHAQSYFSADQRMGRELKRYAVQACKRKFDPSLPAYQSPNMNILRHRPVEECMCPERALLFKESCLNGCSVSPVSAN